MVLSLSYTLQTNSDSFCVTFCKTGKLYFLGIKFVCKEWPESLKMTWLELQITGNEIIYFQ